MAEENRAAPEALDAFTALASPVRRQLLMALRGGPRSASELASVMPIGRPAVSEHLQALLLAGLARVERRGRARYYYMDPRPLADVGAWLNAMLVNWTRRLSDINELTQGDRRL
jgi:DNA-binding transcriptional ArsR family regulator